MTAYDNVKRLAVGDQAQVLLHASPAHWRGRMVWITNDEGLSSGSHNVYRAEWVEDNTEVTAFYGHELKAIKPKADQTINIDVNLGLDVATMTAQVVAAVAKSLRDAADQIEGKA